MGKAKINSGSDGVYDITYYYDVTHAQQEIAKLTADIDAADIQIAALITLRDAQQTKVDGLITALNIKIGAFGICASSLPVCSTYKEQLDRINADIASLEQEKLLLFGYTESVERLKGDKLSDEKRRGFLTSLAPATASMTVYSVDNPEDDNGDLINTIVGTVDPMANHGSQVSSLDMPRVHTILRPLYNGGAYSKARDKAATPIAGMSVPQAISVAVQFPYAQKVNPKWTTAIIKAIDYAAELVDVDVYGNTPSDPAPTAYTDANPLYSITAVPVTYMECGVFAFKVGDYVIVEFYDINRRQPAVIGFVRNPRKCPRFNGWWINHGKYVHSSYDISNNWTWLPNSGIGGNLSWTGWGKGGGGVKTVSWWGRVGKHFGANFTLAARAKNAYMDGNTYTFPYAVFGCCAKRETVGAVKHWFIYALCRPQRLTTPQNGTFESGTGYSEMLYKMRDDGVGGAVLVWSGAALENPGYSAPERFLPTWSNINPVLFNQSATAGVCVSSSYPRIIRYNLTTSDRAVSATQPADFLYPQILAIEFDNDREIKLNYNVTGTGNPFDPDSWSRAEWALDIEGVVIESGIFYEGDNYGTPTESYGTAAAILGANLVAGGVVLAMRDHHMITPGRPGVSPVYDFTYRVKVMGEELQSRSVTGTAFAGGISGTYVAPEPLGTSTQYTFPMTAGMWMAHGPDGKYVFYAGNFLDVLNETDPTTYPQSDVGYIGRFANSGITSYLFKSNDISRITFEAQSGASLPYAVSDLGVI